MKRMERRFFMSYACTAIFAAQHPLFAAAIDPQKAKAADDGKVLWYDCKDIGVEGKGWAETKSFYDRFPAKSEKSVPEKDWNLSHNTAGMYVRFVTSGTSVQVRWTLAGKSLAMAHMPATGVSGVDLYAKDKNGRWDFVGNGRPNSTTNTSTFSVHGGAELMLYLPLYNGLASLEIGIPPGQTLSTPERGKNKPIVWYGHSITQGGCASRPGMASLNITGRALNHEIINLGFSGSGTMAIELATLIAELDPAAYVLDCLGNMKAEWVRERVAPFVKLLRAAHPDTPIVLIDECDVKNRVPTQNGKLLKSEYDKLVAAGIKNLHFVGADGVLGNDGEGTVDGVHPNDLGMSRQADAFIKALTPILRIEK